MKGRGWGRANMPLGRGWLELLSIGVMYRLMNLAKRLKTRSAAKRLTKSSQTLKNVSWSNFFSNFLCFVQKG